MDNERTEVPEVWGFGIPTAQEHLDKIDRLPQYNKDFTGDYPEAYFLPRPLDDPSYPGEEPNSQSFLDVQRTMLSLKADAEADVHGQKAKAFYKRISNKIRRQIKEQIAEELKRDNQYTLMQQKEKIIRAAAKMIRDKVERQVRLEMEDQDEAIWRMRVSREIEEDIRQELEGEWDEKVRREVEIVREECRREYEEKLEEYKQQFESGLHEKDEQRLLTPRDSPY